MLVGGLVAFGTYKMSTRDAQRIEESTGVPPEEMTDQELEQAMDQLGIDKQTVTDADQEAGGGAAPSSGGTDDMARLEQLAELHAQGVLTDEEFAAKKAQILGLG